jgi:hypothetical protein
MTSTRKPTRVSNNPRARAAEWKVLHGTDRVRWSRVQTAQARIASGYYEREDVQEYVVEQLLRELRNH